MREMSLAEDLFREINEIASKERLGAVRRVRVEIGVLRKVEEKILACAFQTISRGSVAENAKLEVQYIPITMQCETCMHIFTVQEQTYICPACDKTKLKFIRGKELQLKEIQ